MVIPSRVWSPLSASTRQIRVLAIQPSEDPDADLSLRLIEKSLDRHPRYDALSYAWGGAQSMRYVSISDQLIPITANLHSFLRHLRHKSEVGLYWVDALCINQYDPNERSQQVQQMEHIFRTAEKVHVWLGDAKSLHMSRVFRVMKLFASGEKFGALRLDGAHLCQNDLSILSLFVSSLWFNRLWVRQEFALARDVVFHHRSDKILWTDVERFNRAGLAWLKAIDKSNTTVSSRLSQLAKELADIVHLRQLLRENSLLDEVKYRFLVDQMASLRECQVSTVSDRIYGMVGIFTALFENDLVIVDYNKTPQEVFISFAREFICATRSPDLLNQANAEFNKLQGLPSWVPDWSSYHDFSAERMQMRYYDLYSATLNRRMPTPNFFPDKPMYIGLALSVLGNVKFTGVVAQIDDYMNVRSSELIKRMSNYKKLSKCLESWEHEWKQHMTDISDLARTVFRDLRLNATFKTRERIESNAQAFETYQLLRTKISPEKLASIPDINSADRAQIHLCIGAVAMSRFFITNDGKPGLGPIATQVGDVLALIPGGHVPYVLRKVQDDELENVYSFVGECYVNGVMDGEVVKDENFPGFVDGWLV